MLTCFSWKESSTGMGAILLLRNSLGLYDRPTTFPQRFVYMCRATLHVLDRSYSGGHFDLADIDVHNGIEHDASLLRT